MPSKAGSGSSAVRGPSWEHEPAVRAAVRDQWGLRAGLHPVYATAGSRAWQAGGHVVKIARDEPAHFAAGLRASEAVEEAGITAGAPVHTRASGLCVPLSLGRQKWALAVLRRVAGSPLPWPAS